MSVGLALLVLVVGGVGALSLQAQGEIPDAKAALLAQQANALATARASQSPQQAIQAKLNDPGAPTPESSYPRPESGIIEAHEGPLPNTRFQQQNVWQGPVGTSSTWLQVGAGQMVNSDGSLGSGAVTLATLIPDPTDGNYQYTYIGTLPAPTTTGALGIVAVNGGVLQLQTDGGQSILFDLQTRQFRTS